MLVNRQKVEEYIEKRIPNIMFDNTLKDQVYGYCYEKFNIPKSLIDDFLSMRKAIGEANEFILFIIVQGFEQCKVPYLQTVDTFFTANEIQMYSQYKYQIEDLQFPLRFNMTQVTAEQWIGYIDAHMLMRLRRAQMIRYNEHTQRVMQRVTKGKQEYYKISVNAVAVREISELLQKELYISDTITLNIPMESEEADYYYDKDTHELVVNRLDFFDILDGYHRYLSIGMTSDVNPDFNYPMELRIVNWDSEKARRFVFQMDKKTKMRKIDAQSFDAISLSNRITSRLNESAESPFRGEIRTNGGILPYADIAAYVKLMFCQGLPTNRDNYYVMYISTDIIASLNALVEYDMTYLTRHYDKKEMVLLFYICSKFYEQDKKKIGIAAKMLNNAVNASVDHRKFNSFPYRSTLLKTLDQVWEQVKYNV